MFKVLNFIIIFFFFFHYFTPLTIVFYLGIIGPIFRYIKLPLPYYKIKARSQKVAALDPL